MQIFSSSCRHAGVLVLGGLGPLAAGTEKDKQLLHIVIIKAPLHGIIALFFVVACGNSRLLEVIFQRDCISAKPNAWCVCLGNHNRMTAARRAGRWSAKAATT